MFKKIAPIVILLGSSVAPLAWALDDPGSDSDEVQTSDESFGEESEANVADESFDGEEALAESLAGSPGRLS